MDDAVDPSEQVTRYLRNSNHMRIALQRPHYSAFMPRVQDGEISVFRTSAMPEAEIVGLGAQFVGRPDVPLRGHCNLLAEDIFSEGLNVEPAPAPHERHANIVGWATDPKNRIIARKLADKARLVAN